MSNLVFRGGLLVNRNALAGKTIAAIEETAIGFLFRFTDGSGVEIYSRQDDELCLGEPS